MISFAEAANYLENLCLEIDNAEEIDAAMQMLFQDSAQELAHQVDRRISFIKYAESQVDAAKKMRDEWQERADKFDAMIDRIKSNTVSTIKANPGVPYKGKLGALRVQKNSVPSLVIDDEESLLSIQRYQRRPIYLDKGAVKRDLEQDLIVHGARLEYGEHLRIGVK